MKLLTNLLGNKTSTIPYGSEECSKYLKEKYSDTTSQIVILDENHYKKLEEYDQITKDIKILESKKR